MKSKTNGVFWNSISTVRASSNTSTTISREVCSLPIACSDTNERVLTKQDAVELLVNPLSASRGRVVGSVVHVASRACPKGADVFLGIEQDGGQLKLDEEIDRWSERFDAVVTRVSQLYAEGGSQKWR